jgi:hypothetical protein
MLPPGYTPNKPVSFNKNNALAEVYQLMKQEYGCNECITSLSDEYGIRCCTV